MTRRTVYVRIVKDKDPGYHLQLTDGPARTQPLMQSRKLRSVSEAKNDAKHLFGLLNWREPADFNIELSWMVAMATITVEVD